MSEAETQIENTASTLKTQRKHPWKKIFLLFWIVVTLYLVYAYWQSHRLLDGEREAQAIREKISEHVLLGDAVPAVVTVSDAEKLRGTDPFYQHAENGDKLILWEEKALLYRPSDDRIVDFGVVLRSAPAGTETGAPSSGQ